MIENGCHTTTLRVRYAETDKMGLAYNGHYLTWFEVGRTEFIREMGFSYKEMENAGFRLPVIEACVKYLKPVYYDDVLTIKSSIRKKSGLRMRIDYEILRGADLLATGFNQHVFTDKNLCPKKPPKNITKTLIEIWEKNCIPEKEVQSND